MPRNERNTENLVRDRLRKLGYYAPSNDIRVEEQKSLIDSVRRLLREASKSGKGGAGYPEFLISSPSQPDFLLVVECKADTNRHVSTNCKRIIQGDQIFEDAPTRIKRISDFAVDGVLHYAEQLAKEFNVIGVAVSGETVGSATISTFIFPKGSNSPKALKAKTGAAISSLIPWNDYVEHATFDPSIQKLKFDELMEFSRQLHDFMRDHAKLTESEKPLLVSGTLIALRNKAFAESFGTHSPEDLAKQWLRVIKDEIEKAQLPNSKKNSMAQPYSSISVHPELGKSTKAFPKGPMHELIRLLHEKVWPFIQDYHDFDVVGQFYGEFLKYTGGDKKALGIVLTPRHITELFSLLAGTSKNSKVLDICAGTGGFLISAMNKMMKGALTQKEREHIRKNCLFGVEQQPNMYALAASNMILRGDGKANLYQGSCFDAAISKDVRAKRCDIGMVNPPYAQGDQDLHELVFVKHMLDMLAKGATGIAIVPMSCAIARHSTKTELLRAHTLEAVMSMPDDLFYPVGTVTCIMVFTAHKPHEQSGAKTWFGYWKSDGFVKTKTRGRVDLNGKWPDIRSRWIDAFRNRDDIPGMSVKRKVGATDEWCAEAYMETDYSSLAKDDFEAVVRKYAVFKLLGGKTEADADEESSA